MKTPPTMSLTVVEYQDLVWWKWVVVLNEAGKEPLTIPCRTKRSADSVLRGLARWYGRSATTKPPLFTDSGRMIPQGRRIPQSG